MDAAESSPDGCAERADARAAGHSAIAVPSGDSTLTLEVARGYTDLSGVRRGWRANLVASASY